MEDDMFCVSRADVNSMLLLVILFAPSKCIQGGRHLSFEQSRLSKDANIGIQVNGLPMCRGKPGYLFSLGLKDESMGSYEEVKSNHDVTKLLALDHFPSIRLDNHSFFHNIAQGQFSYLPKH
jgi:hypothetical protein